MTEKELKRLSRKRLLEILAEQTGRANRLQRENKRLKERIADREQYMSQIGELAEAILHSSAGAAEKGQLVPVLPGSGAGEERRVPAAKYLNRLLEGGQAQKAAGVRQLITRISQRSNSKR